jgi:hypothetical protein
MIFLVMHSPIKKPPGLGGLMVFSDYWVLLLVFVAPALLPVEIVCGGFICR